MGSNGDGEAPGDGSAEIARVAKSVAVRDGRPDLSPAAVNQRLSAFVAEHRAKPAAGPFAESDAILCAWAENALAYQEEAQRKLAEAQAKVERLEFDRRGGQLQ